MFGQIRRFLGGTAGCLGGGPKAAIPSGLDSVLGVAVGTNIAAARPPRRSVREEFPHTAPLLDTSVEAGIGMWMKSTRTRNPPIEGCRRSQSRFRR